MKRKAIIGVIAAAMVVMMPLVATTQEAAKKKVNPADTYRQLDLFGTVFERVRANYVKEVTDEQLIEAAIKGMLTSLDPHSSYLTPKSFGDMKVNTKGEFGGLGIEVTTDKGYVKVIAPIDETPAARAGVQAGDLITHIDGKSIAGLSLNQAVERMRGKVNTDITITIRRKGAKAFDITITRAVIKIRAVRARAEGNVAYLRITAFNEQTFKSLEEAVARMKKKIGSDLAGYVVDLRNNPGGLLTQAIAVSDAFLDKGEIVSTRGRRADESQRWNAKKGDLAEGKPVVVLINGGSASASEIVAGALQDHRRAMILGTQSFGKGSVQTIVPLPGRGAMRLTTALYYTPRGTSIQGKGITPDIKVAQAKIEPLDAGPGGRREADLRGTIKNPNAPKAGEEKQKKDEKPGAEKKPEPGEKPKPEAKEGEKKEGDKTAKKPAPKKTTEDYQLARALDLIRGVALFKGAAVN